MQRLPKTNFRLIILFAILAVFAACTTADEGKKIQEEKVIETVVHDTGMTGTLDTLYIDSSTFASLPKGALFLSFVFTGNNALTLYGWSDKEKKPRFDTDPNIKLLKAKASTLKYGPDVRFGNVVLTKKEVESIKDSLKVHKSKYVLFVPKTDGERIGYLIFVTNDDPMALAKIAPDPTGVEANPSPPKPWEEE